MSRQIRTFHSNENDAIKGERIVIEARRFSDPHRISGKTHKHGAARVKADNAEAWVERPYAAGTVHF